MKGKKDKRNESSREIYRKRKKRKQCNGFNLNPHDINSRFDHIIQHKEFNFHGDKTNKKKKNKKGMRG